MGCPIYSQPTMGKRFRPVHPTMGSGYDNRCDNRHVHVALNWDQPIQQLQQGIELIIITAVRKCE